MKFLKTLAVIALAALTFSLALGCNNTSNKENPAGTGTPEASQTASSDNTQAPTEEPTSTPEPTPAPEISSGNFNLAEIKTGDKVSVFTLTDKTTDGDNTTLVFQGILTVNGMLENRGGDTCIFKCTEEYAGALPSPEGIKKSGEIILSAITAETLLGATQGAFSITFSDYTLVINGDQITESVSMFEKSKTEHIVVG